MKDTKDLFYSFPKMESERIRLKKLEEKDAAALNRMAKRDVVYRYLPTFLAERQSGDMLAVIRKSRDDFSEKRSVMLGIYWKEDSSFCGLAEIYHYRKEEKGVTIGYRLAREYWGKGIATEVVALLVEYLFRKTDVEWIVASHFSENPASGKVLAKNGFQRIAASVEEDWGYPQKKVVDRWRLCKENG